MGVARRVFLLALLVLAAGVISMLAPLSASARTDHVWRAKTATTEEEAANKAQEEAANKAEEEAIAKAAPKLTITIATVKVSSTSLLVTVDLSRIGSVTVTGPGLKPTVKTFTGGTIRVPLTASGKKEFKEHKKIKVSANIRVADTYGYATKLVKL